MTTTPQSMRDEFEAWARKEHLPLHTADGSFEHSSTHNAWKGWQAATKNEREACALICDAQRDMTERMGGIAGDRSLAAAQVLRNCTSVAESLARAIRNQNDK